MIITRLPEMSNNRCILISCSPYLFVSDRHEDKLGDLVKMLKGEEVDEVSDLIIFK